MPAKAPSKTTSGARKMPKFKPAPAALKEQFAALVAKYPQAEPRTMFSYPAAFVNGQMFMSLFGDSMMLRLSEADRAKFLKQPNTKLFEPMPGRPMKEYVQVTSEMLTNSTALNKWVKSSIAYAQSLPPKTKKATKPKHV